MINRTLLLGNGLNRAIDKDRSSWSNLLMKLEKLSDIPIANFENKPLPLVFEQLRLNDMYVGKNPSHLLESVSRILSIYRENKLEEIYSKITKNILSTNYTHISFFCHEKKLNIPKQKFPNINENTHSLFRSHQYKNLNVWNIHGSVHIHTSILLGHNQYAKYLAQIRDYLYKGVKYSKAPTPYKSTLLTPTPDFKFDSDDKVYSWVDLFLRDEIHVVGFGMDFTENILWWLLTEKIALQLKYPSKVGPFIYYKVIVKDHPDSIRQQAVMEMMRDIGIRIIEVEAETYYDGYVHIANKLKPGIFK